MDAVSLAMKHMASELNVAVFALAQLSRAVEARADKRPMMSDLKESGDLEQDADSVILLYREEYYLEKVKPKSGEKLQGGKDAFEEWERDMFARSEEHTSELQSLLRISYAVFCVNKKKNSERTKKYRG